MPNLNVSSQIFKHLILNVSVKEPQNFVWKYYLLTKLLPFKVWRQNKSISNTALHTAVTAVMSCWRNSPNCAVVSWWNSRLHCSSSVASNSPDLNPVDYRIWGKLQERVYRNRIRDVDQLKWRLIEEWEQFQQSVINEAIKQWRQRLRACIQACGGHFEHKL